MGVGGGPPHPSSAEVEERIELYVSYLYIYLLTQAYYEQLATTHTPTKQCNFTVMLITQNFITNTNLQKKTSYARVTTARPH
jgi:hypothetical protein